jgi:hypothetical protein
VCIGVQTANAVESVISTLSWKKGLFCFCRPNLKFSGAETWDVTLQTAIAPGSRKFYVEAGFKSRKSQSTSRWYLAELMGQTEIPVLVTVQPPAHLSVWRNLNLDAPSLVEPLTLKVCSSLGLVPFCLDENGLDLW